VWNRQQKDLPGPDMRCPKHLSTFGVNGIDRVVLGRYIDPSVIDERFAIDRTIKRVVIPRGTT